jgi:hypothetical protein
VDKINFYKSNYIFLALGFLCLALFGQALNFDFFFLDDNFHVVDNPHSSLTFENIKWYWTNSKTPIPYNFWQVIEFINGKDNPYLFRLTNILIHSINSLLVYKIFLRLLSKKSEFFSVIGAVIFLLHPLQVESVVWVSSLRGLLSGLFVFLSLYFYLNSLENKKNQLLTLTFYALSLICKPTSISLVLVFVIFDKLFFKLNLKSIIKRNASYLLALILGIAFFSTDVLIKIAEIKILDNIALSIDSLSHYILSFIFPYHLTVSGQGEVIGWNEILTSYKVYFFLAFIITMVIVSIRSFKTKSLALVLPFTLYLILIFPVSGIVNFHFQMISSVADRYMYVPILGLIYLMLELVMKFDRKSIKKLCVSLSVIFFAISYIQVSKWKDEKIVANESKESSFFYQMMLASLHLNKGELDKAEIRLKKAKTINPSFIDSDAGLMQVYLERNDLELGEELAKKLDGKLITDINLYSNYLKLLSANDLEDKAVRISKKNYMDNQYNEDMLKQYFNSIEVKFVKTRDFILMVERVLVGKNRSEILDLKRKELAQINDEMTYLHKIIYGK